MPSDAEKDSNWAERIEGQELANDEADIYESFKSTPGSNSVWRPRVSREWCSLLIYFARVQGPKVSHDPDFLCLQPGH